MIKNNYILLNVYIRNDMLQYKSHLRLFFKCAILMLTKLEIVKVLIYLLENVKCLL